MIRKILSIYLTGLLLCTSLVGAADAAQPQVLILQSADGRFSNELFRGGIEPSLERTPGGVTLFTELYDAERFPAAEHDAALARFLRDKYANHPIDLVIALGPAPLTFLSTYRDELFPNTPVLFTGVRESRLTAMDLPPNMTGVAGYFDVVDTLELALALQPEARRVVFVSGTAPLDVAWQELATAQSIAYARRLEVTHLAGQPITEVYEEVSRLPPDSIVILLTIVRDGAGQYLRPQAQRIAASIAAASSAPVYGVYEIYVGSGVVGGHLDRFEALGAAVGTLAMRVLAGEAPSELPVQQAAGEVVVDWRALQRWGLDESRLPRGAVVMYRDLSLWNQYRAEIVGVLGLVALQTLLIITLLTRMRKRRAERALLETEQRYRKVVEAQTDLICRYLPDTTLTFVNDAYCRYFGRTRDELIGRKFVELIPEDEQIKILDHVRSLHTNPRTGTSIRQFQQPDGSRSWLQWMDHVIVDADSAVVELQGIGRDITQQRLAEIEAQQRRDQVAHLTRVAILGELSGSLAHELNQPLTAILSNAQAAERLLQHDNVDVGELKEILSDVVADDIRAGEVISRLRALLKNGTTDREALDINGIAKDVLALAHSELVERHVVVMQRAAADVSLVLGDRVQLQQVLLNLLMNASDAVTNNAPGDRTVTVETRTEERGTVVISVSDNGSGLAPDVAKRLFEPFFTTKPNGLGLGLSICRSIVAAHGGHLAARNNPERGATVEFTLPAAADHGRATVSTAA